METHKVIYWGKHYFLFLIWLALFVQCSNPKSKFVQQKSVSKSITVGVFNGNGGAQSCIWEMVAAIRLDPEMSVRMITTADIAGNVLDTLDAIIIPGGGGKRQYQNLGTQNLQRLRIL